jgi:hypothetical protein
MKHAALIAEALLPGAKHPEVLASFGDNIASQRHGDPSQRFAFKLDVEVDHHRLV